MVISTISETVSRSARLSPSCPTRKASRRVAMAMNDTYIVVRLSFDIDFDLEMEARDLMNRMFTHIRMMSENELLITFLIISKTES